MILRKENNLEINQLLINFFLFFWAIEFFMYTNYLLIYFSNIKKSEEILIPKGKQLETGFKIKQFFFSYKTISVATC